MNQGIRFGVMIENTIHHYIAVHSFGVLGNVSFRSLADVDRLLRMSRDVVKVDQGFAPDKLFALHAHSYLRGYTPVICQHIHDY